MVKKIADFTVRFAPQIGQVRFPNLKITLAAASARTWSTWHRDFVIKGHNDQSSERGGTLTFLDTDLTTELARIEFRHLGIFKLAPEKVEPGGPNTKRLTAELYCEEMTFIS